MTKTDRLKSKKEKLKKYNDKLEERLKVKKERDRLKLEIKLEKKHRARIINQIKDHGFFDIKGRIRSLKDKFFPERSYLINMELRNGNFSCFLIIPQKDSFKYMKGEYIIDSSMKYFNVSSQIWCLDYHQDISIPIKRRVNIAALKKNIKVPGVIDVDTAINPVSLRDFIESEVIQKVMKGEELDNFFRFMKMATIILLIICGLTFILMLKSSGILQSVLS